MNTVFKADIHHTHGIRRGHVQRRLGRGHIGAVKLFCEQIRPRSHLWCLGFMLVSTKERFTKKKVGSQKCRSDPCPSFCPSLVHKTPLQKNPFLCTSRIFRDKHIREECTVDM